MKFISLLIAGILSGCSDFVADKEPDYIVLFDNDSIVISAQDSESLSNLIVEVKANKNVTIEIIGHTDSVGNGTYNRDLSLKRAHAVKSHLVHSGSENTLFVSGYGKTKPQCNADSQESEDDGANSCNRRVDIYIND